MLDVRKILTAANAGAGIYSTSDEISIANNSILEANSGGRLPQLLCLSSSNMSTVGDWISPDGRSLITTQNDPFDVIFGDDSNPGQLVIETPLKNPSITTAHEGVYSCAIPNNSGETEYVYVGIYLHGSVGQYMSLHFVNPV